MLTAIRRAMADRLNDAFPDVAFTWYVEDLTPPYGYIYPGGLGDTVIEYDRAFDRGAVELALVVRVGIGTIDDEDAQETLDEMISFAMKEALELERPEPVTLGGLVDSLAVSACSGYARYLVEGRGPVLGAEWQVNVLAEGKP